MNAEMYAAFILFGICILAVALPLFNKEAWIKAGIAHEITQEELAAREKGMSMDDYRHSLQCESTCLEAGYTNGTYVMRNSILAWSRECWCFGGLAPARVW